MKNRKPNRLKDYDYSRDNLYFVTSCVQDMVCCFGDVVIGTEPEMMLNDFGKIADRQWYWLAEQYAYVVLHEFIVMPNHIHGIIEIKRNRDPSVPRIKSLSELMGAYKMTVSKQIHLAGDAGFAWQRSFHDRIIRDEKAYENISNYIIDNPKKWPGDKFYR